MPGDGIGTEIMAEALKVLAKQADAVLFGAVGDWQYDKFERHLRPEQAILGLRKSLEPFANFRPAICCEELTHASTLKPEVVAAGPAHHPRADRRHLLGRGSTMRFGH